MEEQQRSGWRIAGKVVLWISCIGVTLSLVISLYGGYRHGWQWAGLVKNADFPKRTLWDWFQLLIIPAVLAGGGLWFNRRQQAHTLETEKLRAQDEALHVYLERMSQLPVHPDHPCKQRVQAAA